MSGRRRPNTLSKRDTALAQMRFAGFHGISTAWVRAHLLVYPLGRHAERAAWAAGAAAKIRGARCGCPECKGATDV